MPEFVLHNAPQSTCSQRVRYMLHAKGKAFDGPWLMGKDMTLADIAIMPVIVRADDINLGHLWAAYPAIAAWLDNIRATDAFAGTYYHGSLLAEQNPHLQDLKARSAAA